MEHHFYKIIGKREREGIPVSHLRDGTQVSDLKFFFLKKKLKGTKSRKALNFEELVY